MSNQEFQEAFMTAVSRMLAHRLGISAPTIRRYLRGETAPHPYAMEAILRELKGKP